VYPLDFVGHDDPAVEPASHPASHKEEHHGLVDRATGEHAGHDDYEQSECSEPHPTELYRSRIDAGVA
jgi:hypothetical protein